MLEAFPTTLNMSFFCPFLCFFAQNSTFSEKTPKHFGNFIPDFVFCSGEMLPGQSAPIICQWEQSVKPFFWGGGSNTKSNFQKMNEMEICSPKKEQQLPFSERFVKQMNSDWIFVLKTRNKDGSEYQILEIPVASKSRTLQSLSRFVWWVTKLYIMLN